MRKKFRSVFIALTLLFGVTFTNVPTAEISVHAQGTQESKSKGPSQPASNDPDYDYLLWLFLMWLIWGSL